MKSVQIRSFFWSVFSRIRNEYGDLLREPPYSVRIKENTDLKNVHTWTLFIQSYIKDTNEFLTKLQNFPKFPDDVILCTIDAVALYPNIPNHESLLFLKKALHNRQDKTASTESLIELAELVLKNNCFEFNDRFRKQKESTAIGTGFTPTHAIILTVTLGEEILEFLF